MENPPSADTKFSLEEIQKFIFLLWIVIGRKTLQYAQKSCEISPENAAKIEANIELLIKVHNDSYNDDKCEADACEADTP